MTTALGSVKNSRLKVPPSRPMPESPTPPNGARRSRTKKQLTQTVPARSAAEPVVLLGRQRSELGGLVLRVAGHQGLRGGHEAVGELGVDAALDVQPRAGQADLARVAEDGADRPGNGTLKLGVVEHDVGAL